MSIEFADINSLAEYTPSEPIVNPFFDKCPVPPYVFPPYGPPIKHIMGVNADGLATEDATTAQADLMRLLHDIGSYGPNKQRGVSSPTMWSQFTELIDKHNASITKAAKEAWLGRFFGPGVVGKMVLLYGVQDEWENCQFDGPGPHHFGPLMGYVSLTPKTTEYLTSLGGLCGYNVTNLSYGLDPHFAGKGWGGIQFAPRMGLLLLNQMRKWRNRYGTGHAQAVVSDKNVGSKKILERFGFSEARSYLWEQTANLLNFNSYTPPGCEFGCDYNTAQLANQGAIPQPYKPQDTIPRRVYWADATTIADAVAGALCRYQPQNKNLSSIVFRSNIYTSGARVPDVINEVLGQDPWESQKNPPKILNSMGNSSYYHLGHSI